MLGLVDQVEGQAQGSALASARRRLSDGPQACSSRCRSVRQHLGGRHGRAAGANDLVDAGERGRAERSAAIPAGPLAR